MKIRGRLLGKYVVFFAGLVCTALLVSSLIELYFTYQENKASLVAVQREKAQAAAGRIEQFIREIERQMGWTTQPVLAAGTAGLEQRRVDFLRLMRQVPPITELSYLDAEGREQLRVSRLAMDVLGSQADFSGEPSFIQARAARVYYGPVYFRKESEPYMTLALAGSGQESGVTVAEVNLKFIWDVVSQIKAGKAGHAYVVDGQGALIAHPDISLVLQKTNLAALEQVKAALAGLPLPGERRDEVTIAQDLQRRRVLTAYATIAPLRWSVFVEQPLEEAFAPLRASIQRTVLLLLLGIALSVAASLLLARKMVRPIRALQAGAARIGAGQLGNRIEVHTGDELEALAEQFNSMGAQLQESYANLEQKVEDRTRELTESLEQQTATSEVLRVISSSPNDLTPVFGTILDNAMRLCDAHLGLLFLYEGEEYRLVEQRGASPEFAEALHQIRQPGPHTGLGRIVRELGPVQIPDVLADIAYHEGDPLRLTTVNLGKIRTWLGVPMLKEGELVGALVTYRREVRPFGDKQIALLSTFASQAVIAIENVRLFKELGARNAQLTESLEQQTATSEILSVISSALTDVRPVFRAILERATRLCGAELGLFWWYEGDGVFRLVESHGSSPEYIAWLGGRPHRFGRPFFRETGPWSAGQIEDVRTTEPYRRGDEVWVKSVDEEGFRTLLNVPLVKDGHFIGTLSIYRREVRRFAAPQVESSEDLRRPGGDRHRERPPVQGARGAQPRADRGARAADGDERDPAGHQRARRRTSSRCSMSSSRAQSACAVRRFGRVYRYDGALIDAVAHHGVSGTGLEELQRVFPRPADDDTIVGRVILTRQPIFSHGH